MDKECGGDFNVLREPIVCDKCGSPPIGTDGICHRPEIVQSLGQSDTICLYQALQPFILKTELAENYQAGLDLGIMVVKKEEDA